MKSVLILGAGFAGLELATRLSEEFPDAVDVTIIDSSDAFVFGYSKLDVMFGRMDPATVRLPYAKLQKPGVRFVQERAVSIDPGRRRVTTDKAQYEPDILVVALGADLDPQRLLEWSQKPPSTTRRPGLNTSVPCCPNSREGTS